MRIANPKDFWSGLLFGALGVFVAVYAVMHYQLGSALRMGPGYFPAGIGGIVGILGLVLVVRSFRLEGGRLPRIHLRPLVLIVIASIAFGYLLKPIGLVASTVLMVLVSAAGGHEFRWREAIALAIALAVFSVAVFVYGLQLPFPLWPEAFE